MSRNRPIKSCSPALRAFRKSFPKANGVILYEGPSKLDGAPIVVIATGLLRVSANEKTGDMVQTFIIRADRRPMAALKDGSDTSVCGSCIHRPRRNPETGKVERSCYVDVSKSVAAVFRAYLKGVYPRASAFEAREILAGLNVRLGSYGDPAAAPYAMWHVATAKAARRTGYSHQWRTTDSRFATLVMASADSLADRIEAHAKGYRTFRVVADASEIERGVEIVCATERSDKATCATCAACGGTSSKARVSIAIPVHGVGADVFINRMAA